MEKPILIKDLGTRYATVRSKQKARFGLYKCPYCGNEFEANCGNVKQGFIKSCGCLNKKLRDERNFKHGLSKTHIFDKWRSMIARCYNKNCKGYERYGAKGVTVCKEWMDDFFAFKEWCLNNGYARELLIDRIDTSGNYEPDNCRFLTWPESSQNTRLIHKTNTSGYRGVHFCNTIKKWIGQISSNKVNYKLGSFDTKEKAAQAYNDFVIKHKTLHPLNPIPEKD